MGTIRRQSIISAILLVLSVLLGYLNKIPIGTRALSAAEIGVMGVLLSTARLFGVFAQVGISPIIYRYFPFFKSDKNQRKSFLSFAVIYPVVGLSLILLILYLLKEPIIAAYDLGEKDGGLSLSLVKEYYYLVFPLTIFLVYFDVFASISSSLLRSAAPIFFRDIFAKVIITLLLLACWFNYINFSQFMILFVLAHLIQLLALKMYLAAKGEISFSTQLGEQIKEKKNEIFQYGIFTMSARGTNNLVAWIDSAMVSVLLGMSSAGIYFIFQYFGLLTSIVLRALSPLSLTMIANGFKENDMEYVEDIYRRTAIIQLIGGALILLGIYINLDNIIAIVPPEYAPGAMVGVILGLGRLFDMSAGANGEIITNSKYYRLDFYLTLVMVILTIITNYIFINSIGLIGAAVATALTAILYNFFKWWFVRWKFNMQPYTWNSAKVIGIIVLATLLGHYLPKLDNWYFDVLYRSGITGIFYGCLILFFKVSPDITNAFEMITQKLGLRSS